MRSTLPLLLTAVTAVGCTEPRPGADEGTKVGGGTEEVRPSASGTARDEPRHAARDASAPGLASGAPDAGDLAIARVGALMMEVPIYSEMEFPEREREAGVRRGRTARVGERERVIRLGYLRMGGVAPVFPEAHVRPNCAEGWYELVAGGFVCGRYATVDLNHPKVRLGPHPPDTAAALPYQYGYNLTHGTPLYRTVPARKDRLRFEPWLAPRPKAKPAPASESDNPYAEVEDAGAASLLTGLAAASTRDPLGLGFDEGAGTPWYLRDFDGGKPQVTLDELRGDENTPILRRMVRGFFVGLDKEMKANDAKWWRTTAGHVVPFERIYLHRPPTNFHGLWLKGDAPPWPPPLAAPPPGAATGARSTPDAGATRAPSAALVAEADDAGPEAAVDLDAGAPAAGRARSGPVAFMWSGKGRKYRVTKGAKKGKSATVEKLDETVEWRTALVLTGEAVKADDVVYEETDDGFWVRAADLVRVRPGPAPAGLQPGEKWVDVNLKTQTLVAFEGTTPVFATLVSSGKEDKEDPEKDHKTPTGEWRIWAKHIAATMDGDVASDGPYSIEDVPWIMYFKGSYALHGAFWHGSFGRERSHGCVNLSPADARALFQWTEPALPEGWHGIRSTDARPGTRVVVHE